MLPRVVIDARKLGDGGIGVYIENLVDGLLSLGCSRLVLITSVEQRIPSRWEQRLELIFDNAMKYSFAEYFIMPLRLRAELKNSILHFPHYTVPFFLPRSSKVIVTIHDCIHLKSKSLFKRILSRVMLSWAIIRADRILTVSNYSKESILRNFSFAKPSSIDVVANSVSSALKISAAKQASDYFLFVGNGMQHKGFELAVKALESLKLKAKFVVVGANFSPAQLEYKNKESIVFAGPCSAEQLSNLYANAQALILPSYEEGFGIPALEALSFGLPVVATPVPSLVEWFGDSIWFANRFDVSALASAIKALIEDPINRQRRVELGLNLAKKFTVLQSANTTLEAYRKIAPEMQFIVENDNAIAKVA